MIRFLRPIYFAGGEHLLRLITDKAYRRYWLLEAKIGRYPRFTDCTIDVDGLHLCLPDAASFLSSYKEIFVNNIYKFNHEGDPRILDLGANIGLSVIYFKRMFPGSHITAFEADPKICRYLEKNLQNNSCGDVRIINKAAWCENTVLKFHPEGADGGRIDADGDNSIDVEAVDISEYLAHNKFDFLKMDIEGAENQVVPACTRFLSDFKFVFIEYHSFAGQRQNASDIIRALDDAGFKVHIQSIFSSQSPFSDLEVRSGFDQQLNIFAWK